MEGSESEVNSSPAVHTEQQLLESVCFTDLLLMNTLIPWALKVYTEKSHFGTTRLNANTSLRLCHTSPEARDNLIYSILLNLRQITNVHQVLTPTTDRKDKYKNVTLMLMFQKSPLHVEI